MKKTPLIAIILSFLLLEVFLISVLDRPIALYTKNLEQTAPHLVDFFRSITDMGKAQWYLWPCGVLTLFCGFLSRGTDVPQRWRQLCAYIGVRAFFLFSTIALSGILADIIKPLVGRARPHLWLENSVYGFQPFNLHGSLWNSMPSGHTTTVFALAFTLSILYRRLRPLWFVYAIILGLSRVMVDAHYLSDVCAGAMLGWATVQLSLKYGMLRIWKILFPIETISAQK